MTESALERLVQVSVRGPNFAWLLACLCLMTALFFLAWAAYESQGRPIPHRIWLITLLVALLLCALFVTTIAPSPEWPEHTLARSWGEFFFMALLYLYTLLMGFIVREDLAARLRQEPLSPLRLRLGAIVTAATAALVWYATKLLYILVGLAAPPPWLVGLLPSVHQGAMGVTGLGLLLAYAPSPLIQWLWSIRLRISKLLDLPDLLWLQNQLEPFCPREYGPVTWWEQVWDIDDYRHEAVAHILDGRELLLLHQYHPRAVRLYHALQVPALVQESNLDRLVQVSRQISHTLRKEMRTTPTPSAIAPGPSGVPLLGNLFAVQRDPLGFLERITADYGGVVRYPVAKWQHLYLITDPEGVKQVLVTHQQHYSVANRNRRALKLVMGEGLFVSEGDLWLRQRRLMQPAFHRHHIAALATQMSATIQERLDRWEEAARQGEALNLSEEMMHLALAVATRTLFGVDVSGETAHVGQAVSDLVQVYTRYARSPAVMLPNRVVGLHPRFRAPLQALDAVVQGIIAERRTLLDEPTDTLSLLLALRDEETEGGMSDQQVRDEVMSLLIAGHETTARAMTWLWYLLDQHPEAEARVREEVEQVLAGRSPTAADLTRLEYTRRVVEETLRLYPPAWVTFRKALVADEGAGFPIPAGARITLSPYVTQRRPDLWQEPARFDPDRFLPERSAERHPFAYFPFGGGPRQCIGRAMAMMEVQLMLALTVQRFRLRRVGTEPLRPVARLTLQPDAPLWMVPERV